MTAVLTIDDPEYFDRLAEVEGRHWWSLGMWRLASLWLDKALAGRRDLHALDVGCGAGMTTVRLASRYEMASVVGLDPSPAALERARCHDLPLVRGTALNLPFGDGRFDVVTCFDVWQHLPPGGDRRAARELSRVLSPGGIVILRSNARGWSGDTSTYRLDDLVSILNREGLAVQRATYGNCLPALVQEARGWSSGLAGQGGVRRSGHPSGGGLTIRMPHPAVNRVMRGLSLFEAWAAGRIGVRWPFGHSTLVLARSRA